MPKKTVKTNLYKISWENSEVIIYHYNRLTITFELKFNYLFSSMKENQELNEENYTSDFRQEVSLYIFYSHFRYHFSRDLRNKFCMNLILGNNSGHGVHKAATNRKFFWDKGVAFGIGTKIFNFNKSSQNHNFFSFCQLHVQREYVRSLWFYFFPSLVPSIGHFFP